MPQGQQAEVVTKKLQARRGDIAKLPAAQQLKLYGFVFDHFVQPRLPRGLSTQDLETAKNQWIVATVKPSAVEPLPPEFGVPAKPPVGKTAGFMGGVAGGVRSMYDFELRLNEFLKTGRWEEAPEETKPGRKLREAATQAEEYWYPKSAAVAPGAETAAGVGKTVASLPLTEIGISALPGMAGMGAVGRTATRAARGATAGTTVAPAYSSDPGQVTKDVLAFSLMDTVLFPVIGVALRKAGGRLPGSFARRAIDHFKRKGGETAKAATQVDDLFSSTATEKFPGKKVEDLNAEQFASVFKDVEAKRAAAQAQVKEGQKAAAAAEKQAAEKAKVTPEQKALEAITARQARDKARAEGKAFQKRLAAYYKRTGGVPSVGDEHYERLRKGESVDQIVGTPVSPEQQAVAKATDEVTAKIISEGSPQAAEAVAVVKQVVGEAEAAPAGVKEKIATAKAKPEPMFKASLDKLTRATTPEDFTKAKKDAMEEISSQAIAKAKSIDAETGLSDAQKTAQKQKVLSEANRTRERVRSAAVPENISKKAIDARRKSTELAEGQAETVRLSEAAMKPRATEDELVADLDTNKQLVKDYLAVGGTQGGLDLIARAWKKASGSGSIKVYNEFLATAIEALRGGGK